MKKLVLISFWAAAAWAQGYPPALNPAKVGSYPALCKSGGGLVYDEVLEYRVWYHDQKGDSTFEAFATFDKAQAFSKSHVGAETPLVLVRQREWINEPDSKHRVLKKGERITEWQPEWLKHSKRSPELVKKLLALKKP